MSTKYTARAYQNPGRKGYVISFRHPMKAENGRPGKKVCKGLGTEEKVVAERLEAEMNSLLARAELHSQAGRTEAARAFSEMVVDIFYGDLDPSPLGHRLLRDELMPLPTRPAGYNSTLLIGITGAAKSTLLRRLLGTHPERDRFPSTSVNRTTTCEIEAVTGWDKCEAIVTFLSRHQTQQAIIESASAAIVKAVEGGSIDAIANQFLEQSDQRFRLKYVLGALDAPETEAPDAFSFDDSTSVEAPTAAAGHDFLLSTITTIKEIAAEARREVESLLGALDSLKGDARDYALDEIQQHAEQSDVFLDLVNAVLDEISERFKGIKEGKFRRSTTGWPIAWTLSMPADRRDDFVQIVRGFAGTSKEQWGTLLTPLVTGIRVAAPFRPSWVPEGEAYQHVYIDTEGLLHAKAATEVPSELTSRFKDVDTILLVESAENALHSPVAGKVFEAVASSGYTAKFTLLFTKMDQVVGDNLSSAESKRQHVFGGARNVLDNHVARNLTRDIARQLATHLETNTFYLAYLDPKHYPTREGPKVDKFEAMIGGELWRMREHLSLRSEPERLQPALPEYSFESLGLAVREASLAFQEIWDARLGYKRSESVPTAPWQSIKAMTRRYAEGWFEGTWLRPIDTLISTTRNILTRFLETPLRWNGKKIGDEDRAAIINRIMQMVNETLTELSKTRLWRVPQLDWQRAYGLSGSGSTFSRRQNVQSILHHQVPVPESVSDRWAQEWVEAIKQLVVQAIETVRKEQSSESE
jgi:hypothetical protein